jgi:predicted RNA methylase
MFIEKRETSGRSRAIRADFMNLSAFTWQSESDTAAPQVLRPVDDTLTADAALKLVRRGEFLLYRGDFLNAKQLLAAIARRLPAQPRSNSPLEAFRSQRRAKALAHETVSRLLVSLDHDYRLQLSRAPDVAQACAQVWGPATKPNTVVPLKTLLGMLGAAEWRRTGLTVPGLSGRLIPHYGVYVPTRSEYVELLQNIDNVKWKSCFDIGTGSGVLGLMLLQRGATSVVGTDIDPRAVACASENAQRLGFGERFLTEQRTLFPEGKADLVICNPPWIPEPAKNRIDRAVFDENNEMLSGFITQLPQHLTADGRGLLIVSNLAVLLGLRPDDFLSHLFQQHGLTCTARFDAAAKHSRAKDTRDPLYQARREELTTLYVLRRASAG